MKNNVNLTKALAAIRQWPGARTDRKVFKTIAERANDKGVANVSLFTIAMAIRENRKTVYESVFRLGEKGFTEVEIEDGIYPPSRYGNPFSSATFTIAPAYMLHTEDNISETLNRIEDIMKTTATNTTPAVRYIDGKPFVRVIDLGHMWHTNTSNILASGKRHHVPEEQLRRIDGRVWCSFQGLRYRVQATKNGSNITRLICEFLDAQEKKTTPTAAKSETATLKASNSTPLKTMPTDLGTAALIADARRTASQALAKTKEASRVINVYHRIALENQRRIEELEKQCAHLHPMLATHDAAFDAKAEAEQNAQRLDKLENMPKTTRNRARTNANRLTKQAARIDKLERESRGRYAAATARVQAAERQQRDNTARIAVIEEHARAIDWTLAAVAILGIVGRAIRLLRRR